MATIAARLETTRNNRHSFCINYSSLGFNKRINCRSIILCTFTMEFFNKFIFDSNSGVHLIKSLFDNNNNSYYN